MKRQSQDRPTFEEAAAETIAIHRSGWRSTTHEVQWRYLLQTHAFPHIGSCRIDDITSADVLAILNPIWHTKAETARRVRQHIGAIMKWAIAQGYRPDNPAGEVIGQVLGRQPEIRHHRALPYEEVAAAIRTVRESEASEVSKLAFEFLVLTAARSGEVRLARWNEMDLVEHLWTIPAERMKMAREHRVPLSRRALENPGSNPSQDQRHRSGVSEPLGTTVCGFDTVPLAQEAGHRSRTPWIPLQLRRLGS